MLILFYRGYTHSAERRIVLVNDHPATGKVQPTPQIARHDTAFSTLVSNRKLQ